MVVGDDVNQHEAQRQWSSLQNRIIDLGGHIEVMEPPSEWPDLVFTANGGVTHKNKVVLSNFKHHERQGEKEYFRSWFKQHHYEVLELQDDMIFEGRGDCFVFKHYLIGGYGKRSERRSIEKTAELLGLEPIPIRLQDDRYYHLDTCLSIIGDDLAIYYPPAHELNIVDLLAPTGLTDLIPITAADAMGLGCNAITIGTTVLLPELANTRHSFETALARRGYTIQAVPMSEFLKSGGGCRCLVLEL
jgi:N-dimethylarginine dimethylaminohydrolase